MKKSLRNLMVVALLTVLSVVVVYAAYTYIHTHYPSWNVASAAIEVQFPIGTGISAGSFPDWGTVYVGSNTRDYRVINRSSGSINVTISEAAPSNYGLIHNVTSPFTLVNNGDFIDIRFTLTVPAAYGASTNNGTITFTATG
jgi:hypothetical protein